MLSGLKNGVEISNFEMFILAVAARLFFIVEFRCSCDVATFQNENINREKNVSEMKETTK